MGFALLNPSYELAPQDTIDASVPFNTAERGIELDDFQAGEEFAHACSRIKRFREAYFAGLGQRLNARGDVHGLAEIVQVLVERHGNGRAAMRADFQDDAGRTVAGIVAL